MIMINSNLTFDAITYTIYTYGCIERITFNNKKWDLVALHHTVMSYFLVFAVRNMLVCLLESHK